MPPNGVNTLQHRLLLLEKIVLICYRSTFTGVLYILLLSAKPHPSFVAVTEMANPTLKSAIPGNQLPHAYQKRVVPKFSSVNRYLFITSKNINCKQLLPLCHVNQFS